MVARYTKHFRRGSKSLGDTAAAGQEFVSVVCDRCRRFGDGQRFKVSELIAQFGGDTAMPDLLGALSDGCPNRKELVLNRCSPRFGTGRRRQASETG